MQEDQQTEIPPPTRQLSPTVLRGNDSAGLQVCTFVSFLPCTLTTVKMEKFMGKAVRYVRHILRKEKKHKFTASRDV